MMRTCAKTDINWSACLRGFHGGGGDGDHELSFCDTLRNDSRHCLEKTLDTLGRSYR
jgi:hypothetical protein